VSRDSGWSLRWVPFRPVRRELCIIETPAECIRPRLKGSQLCAAHDEETDRLAADRLAAGWPA
jgi:hypothetical protein